jgi:hypothetical protein
MSSHQAKLFVLAAAGIVVPAPFIAARTFQALARPNDRTLFASPLGYRSAQDDEKTTAALSAEVLIPDSGEQGNAATGNGPRKVVHTASGGGGLALKPGPETWALADILGDRRFTLSRLDRNGDGKLIREEYVGSDRAEVMERRRNEFLAWDRDGDGFVTAGGIFGRC